MTLHLRFCAECARVDTRVRRALLLAHNLPMIQPSDGFSDRLQTRLRQERAIMAGHAERHADVQGRWRTLPMGTYAALAAGILATASLAYAASVATGSPDPIRLSPVVATLSEREPSTLATSAMVASMPAGFSVWPAVFVAQQAPWHFANDEMGR